MCEKNGTDHANASDQWDYILHIGTYYCKYECLDVPGDVCMFAYYSITHAVAAELTSMKLDGEEIDNSMDQNMLEG